VQADGLGGSGPLAGGAAMPKVAEAMTMVAIVVKRMVAYVYELVVFGENGMCFQEAEV
jgi:hypothetical protein